MKLWKAGDRSAAICERCQKKVSTRFEYRTFDLEKPKVSVPNVLVAVCKECDEIAAVPHQSTPKINEARAKETVSIEARVPREINDALGLIAVKLHARPRDLSAPLIRYYFREMGRKGTVALLVKAYSTKPLALGPAKERVSIKVDRPLWTSTWKEAKEAGIKNKGELIRGVILFAAADCQLIEAQSPDKAAKERVRILEAIAETL